MIIFSLPKLPLELFAHISHLRMSSLLTKQYFFIYTLLNVVKSVTIRTLFNSPTFNVLLFIKKKKRTHVYLFSYVFKR